MKINLKRSFFEAKETELLTHGDIKIIAFSYPSGIEALRVENPKGHFVILPFHGQQIWNFTFGGRDLSMKTTVKEPVYSDQYMACYGGFLYHCGVSAFGVPQADDNHPLHGEIPNIEYNEAYIDCGEDENGKYVAIGGVLNYNLAFTRNYQFCPECRLYENASIIRVNVSVENKNNAPMEYMYLCHINFAPIDGAKLVYSAKRDKDHIKVHKRVGDDFPADKKEKLFAFMDKVQEEPAIHDTVGLEGEMYEPEICFAIKYEGDENNRAYTMQKKPGEGACYVSHPVDALPVGVRWISKGIDEQAMGMVLPATSEHLGYSDSKRKGYVKSLAGKEKLSFYMEVGYLDDAEADAVEKKIDAMLK